MSRYSIHSDFKPLDNKKPLFIPFLFSHANKRTKKYLSKIETPKNINIISELIEGYQGEDISVKIYTPRNTNPDRVLIYCHGGSFAFNEAPYQVRLCMDYAVKTPCKVISVDYRLIPKHPFPWALEDCYKAVKWAHDNAEALGIKRQNIAVGGDDSGAALAAGVTLLARERKEFNIGFQMLIHPITSMKMNTPSMKEYTDTPMWNAKLNQKMWHYYLNHADETRFAAPLDMSNHDHLPNAYIEVAEFDCLRDEGIAYASILERAGIDVELNQTTGTVHGFDVVERSDITLEHKQRRIEALQHHFNSVSSIGLNQKI
jgi:acetyl esterase